MFTGEGGLGSSLTKSTETPAELLCLAWSTIEAFGGACQPVGRVVAFGYTPPHVVAPIVWENIPHRSKHGALCTGGRRVIIGIDPK